MSTKPAEVGMIGMAVMGKNLALNIADRGYTVAVYNRELDVMEAAVKGTELRPTRSLAELVSSLERPRRILMMIQAGKPVDSVLGDLLALVEPGDVVVDGGNSLFTETRRREAAAKEKGVYFLGVGVSGGEEGARRGPSLMPGGDPKAYEAVKPIFEAIAAKTSTGACVTHVGLDGAGHFVKMVHNGIEYADMQCIAEAYDLLRREGFTSPELAVVFAQWNQGPLESFLIQITSRIFDVRDPDGDGYLVDKVLDAAGQKGTGKWTAQVALDLGVAIPSIAAAIDARVLSSMKSERVAASAVLPAREEAPGSAVDRRAVVSEVHDALYAAKIGAYAQGMALIAAASRAYEWGIDPKEMARIWTGGCIIRARFLHTIMRAYEKDRNLPNLLLDETVRKEFEGALPGFRRTVARAALRGIPVPAMSAGLAYYDSYRTAALPQNLTQAQRDAFGAHTYVRSDAPERGAVHTSWLGAPEGA